MKLTIATKGRYEPGCLDDSGQDDVDRPYVEYKLLTGEQIEAILAGQYGKSSWARIWREQVSVLNHVAFEIDGKDCVVPVVDIPTVPGTYPLYYEVASHILEESNLSYADKKTLHVTTAL